MSDQKPAPRSPQQLRLTIDEILASPLHQFYGLDVLPAGRGRSRLQFQVGKTLENVNGTLHGGVLYSVLDVAAYLALVSELPADADAVTHDLHVSVLRPARDGQLLVLESEIVRQGRRVAFMDSRALVDGDVIATARVTKSVVWKA